MHLVSFQPPWDLEIGKKFIIHYTYGCDYSLKVNYSPSLSLSTSICCFSHYDRALGYRVKSKGIFLLKRTIIAWESISRGSPALLTMIFPKLVPVFLLIPHLVHILPFHEIKGLTSYPSSPFVALSSFVLHM